MPEKTPAPAPKETNSGNKSSNGSSPQKKRFSRRDQMRLNPVPWIVLFCVTILLYFFLAHGKLQEWRANKTKINTFTEEIKKFDSDALNLRAETKDLDEKLQEEKDRQGYKERGLFPKSIDNKKIVKILEIFMLKLVNIENKESIRLNSLSLGQNSSDAPDVPGAMRRQVTFSAEMDQEELETLIWYLQNNRIPPRMAQAKEEGRFENDLNDYITLEANPLPLMLIENINRSNNLQEDGKETAFFNVTISGNFYHQAQTDDEPN